MLQLAARVQAPPAPDRVLFPRPSPAPASHAASTAASTRQSAQQDTAGPGRLLLDPAADYVPPDAIHRATLSVRSSMCRRQILSIRPPAMEYAPDSRHNPAYEASG